MRKFLMAAALVAVAACGDKKADDGTDTTLVVTHAGPIRCLLHLVQGVPLLDAIQASIAYGSVTRFE